MNAIPTAWKSIVRNSPVNRAMCCSNQHLTRNDKMVPTGMLCTRFFYDLYIDNISIKPTSQKYFERHFGLDLLWNKIYSIPHLVTVDTSVRIFQFKVSHNTLFLNARLVHLNYSTTPLCSLCENCYETPIHLFCECPVTVSLWSDLKNFFSPSLNFDPLTPQSALLGYLDDNNDKYLIRNHILLLFKYCVYKNRKDTLNIHTILHFIKTTFTVEKNIHNNRVEKCAKKWSSICHLLE